MTATENRSTRNIATVLPLPEADRIIAFARAERRSLSSALALLAAEALDARGFAPQQSQGGHPAGRPEAW